MINVASKNPALDTYLEPLESIFAEDGVNEISINRPMEVWVEKLGTVDMRHIPELTFLHLRSLSDLIAQSTNQFISEERPLLSGTLPNGFRIQIVLPPATESESIAMSIRKPSINVYTLEEYEGMGAFSQTSINSDKIEEGEDLINECITENRVKDLIKLFVKYRKNIIISGGTSSGKTTFTNAVIGEMPTDRRIITIEDAREIRLDNHPNRVHLLSSKGEQGRAKVTSQDLMETCLRLNPTCMLVQELRGAEAFTYLRAINTGHPGSITTIHADNTKMALEQLKLMVLQSGIEMPIEYIEEYILNAVHVVIQLKKSPEGVRYVSEVLYTKHIKNI